MPSATLVPRPQVSSSQPLQRAQRHWAGQPGPRAVPRWTVRVDESMRSVDREAEERLAAMRLLLPLAMILILFVLWYAGMPLLPS